MAASIEQVLQLGRDNKMAELAVLIANQDPVELASRIRRSVRTSDGPASLVYCLQGLGLDTTSNQRHLVEVIDSMLEEISTNSCLTSATITTLLEEIEASLASVHSDGLASIVRTCSTLFEQVKTDSEYPWLRIWAPLLAAVGDLEAITPAGGLAEISGGVYRSRLISELCDRRWPPPILTPMCLMFQEVKLSSNEMEEVFSKLSTGLVKLPAVELGPLVYQILRLVKDDGGCAVRLVGLLAGYFSSRLTLEERATILQPLASSQDHESSDLIGVVEGDHRGEELMQTEGLVIYYIIQAAKIGHPVAKETAAILRSLVAAPDRLMAAPTWLWVGLALTSIKQWREGVVESLRQAASKCYAMAASRAASAWFRWQTPSIPDLPDLFSLIIAQSVRFGGWDLIGGGIIELAFLLLDTQPPLGKVTPRIAALHQLGAAILTAAVCKQTATTARIVLPQLNNRIVVHGVATQYTAALALIVKECASQLMENSGVVSGLIDSLQRVSYPAGRGTLTALAPLLRLARSLRDPLILVLRKALFARSQETRQVAVVGIFTLLKIFKISAGQSLSQLSQSSGSLSELSVDVHRAGGASSGRSTNNESLCSELLGVLRRCFSLQPRVRLTVYQGLNEVLGKNPELCSGFLELMHYHAIELFGNWGDNAPQVELNLGKVIQHKENGWSILEPAGWFLHSLQSLVSRCQQIMDDEYDTESLGRLSGLLELLTERYSSCTVQDLGFDASDNYDRKTEDGQKRCLQVEVLMTVCEALMEFATVHGADRELRIAEQLIGLHRTRKTLSDLLLQGSKSRKGAAGGGKGAKGVGGKKGGGAEEEEVGVKKIPEAGRKRGRQPESGNEDFTMPQHAFSLRSLSLLLPAVLGDRLPAHQAALTRLREEPDLLVYLSRLLTALMERTAGEEPIQPTYKALSTIAAALFRHSIVSREPVEGYLVFGLEGLLAVLRLLFTKYPEKQSETLESLMGEHAEDNSTRNINQLLEPILDRITRKVAALSEEMEKEQEDETGKQLSLAIELVNLLITELREEEEEAEKQLLWARSFTSSFSSENPLFLGPVLQLISILCAKSQEPMASSEQSAKQLHVLFGDLDRSRSVEMPRRLLFLTENTAEFFLPRFLSRLEFSLDLASQLIVWLRAVTSTSALAAAAGDLDLAAKEAAVCALLAHLVNVSTELVNTALPVGSATSDLVLKFLGRLYLTVGNFAKHFFARSRLAAHLTAAHVARFDRLVAKMSEQLSPYVYGLINYIESKHKEAELAAQASRKKSKDPNAAKAKVLKDTKEIPTLIFHMETYDKNIIKLGKRIKMKFNVKVATARDFRIKLTEENRRALAGSQGGTDMEEEEDEQSEEEEEVGEGAGPSAMEDITNTTQADGSQEEEAPSAKKSKLSNKLAKMAKRKENVRR